MPRAIESGRRIVERACAVGVAALLLRSSFAHLANPYQFLDTLYSYRLGPAALGPWIAALVPPLQLAIAVCLLAKWWPRAAYALAFGMTAAFTGIQIVTLSRGLDISCGCFGTSSGLRIGWQSLTVAAGCAAACAAGFACTPREAHYGPPRPSGVHAG